MKRKGAAVRKCFSADIRRRINIQNISRISIRKKGDPKRKINGKKTKIDISQKREWVSLDMKRCSLSLVIMEMHVQMTMRYHFIPTVMDKKPDSTRCH